MEEQQTEQDKQKNLVVTPTIQSYLKQASGWAKFLAILGFVGIGFMVLGGIVMLASGSMMGMMGKQILPSGINIVIGVLYIGISIAYFFPINYLYQFSDKVKLAIDQNNQQFLENAFAFLKKHYRFIGIFTIAIIALYFVMLVVGVIVGFAAMAPRY